MIAKTKAIKNIEKFTDSMPTIRYVDPEYVYLAVQNARCQVGDVLVKEGDYVKIGDKIALRHGPFFEQPVHSTVSGVVEGIVKKYHRCGKLVDFIKIKNDKKDVLSDSYHERTDEEIKALTKDEFVEILKEQASVGLGGSSFPTYIKFQTDDPIHTICINGVECEPYLSADHRIILEHPDRVLTGAMYCKQVLKAKRVCICIKKKYEDLYDCLNAAKLRYPDLNLEVIKVGNYYPQGWELEMLRTALHLDLEPGSIPAKSGVMVLNVSTVAGIYQSVKFNLPVIKRNFTLTGDGIKLPQNIRIRVGTSLKELIELCGGYKGDSNKVVILGGPMMGANLLNDDAVITKACTSCIILNERNYKEDPCVRCASCVYSCPCGLQPVLIMQAYKNKDKEALKMLGVKKCILCGMCSYTCTSKIHLTEIMRKAKKMIQ